MTMFAGAGKGQGHLDLSCLRKPNQFVLETHLNKQL